MFRSRRVLEEISGTLAGMGGGLEAISETLRRMDARMDREFKLSRAALENNTRVTREILLELRDHRPILEHIDRGVQSNVDGLLHVLDELRNGGPGTAPAA